MDGPLHQVEMSAREARCAQRVHDTTSMPSSVTLASYVDLQTRFQRDVPDKRATHRRQERVCHSEDGKQTTRTEDLWSHICRWDVQSAGLAARRLKEDLRARNCEGFDEVAALEPRQSRWSQREEQNKQCADLHCNEMCARRAAR